MVLPIVVIAVVIQLSSHVFHTISHGLEVKWLYHKYIHSSFVFFFCIVYEMKNSFDIQYRRECSPIAYLFLPENIPEEREKMNRRNSISSFFFSRLALRSFFSIKIKRYTSLEHTRKEKVQKH